MLIDKIRKWYRDWQNKGTPYLLSLEELIARAESRMKLIPSCPYCQNEMKFRHSVIVVDVFPIRDDVGYKCIKCFHTAHFGNPMTREDALEEIRLRGSKYLTRPTYRTDERDLEIVKERLRKLGYIE